MTPERDSAGLEEAVGQGRGLDLDAVLVLFYFEAVADSEAEGMLIEGGTPA
jgi:hypothetical protein